MILLIADLRQFVIIFFLFLSWITPTAIWSWQRKNTKQGKTNNHTFPNRNALANVLLFIFFLLVNFRQIMWNSTFIKMSGKKTVFQRQYVSLSKHKMQQGLEHYICREERGKLLGMIIKYGVGYKNWICKGLFYMLVTFFLWGAYHKEITQILNGIPFR